MRLALNAHFWDQPHTGSGQYTRQLVYHLRRQVSDLDITLVWPQTPNAVPPTDVPPGVTLMATPARPGAWGKLWFEQYTFPRAAAAGRADVAHVPYWGAPLTCPVPLVTTIHDLTTHLVREYRRSLKARLYNALVSAGARGASHVITDSHASRQAVLTHLGLPAERVSVVYLGVTPAYTSQSQLLLDMAVAQKYDLPDFYVLYLGGYELHKNVTTLLLAYTYVGPALGESYPLLLAGRPPTRRSASWPDYNAYIERLALGPYVRWIGYVAEEDKPAVYRQASAFVFPSRAEGFGLPVLEAMACGAPVITTTAGALPEVVGEAGFAVDPDNARDMAGAIIATLVQENLAADMRRKGLAQAARFRWETTAHETLLIYDRLSRS